jgi:hypothetical protein
MPIIRLDMFTSRLATTAPAWRWCSELAISPPLRDELIPLLMARSGQALDEFG